MKNRIEDRNHQITNEAIVELLWKSIKDIPITPNPVFLGLGVGSAKAELSLAQQLNARTIGLVDRHDRFSFFNQPLDKRTHFFQADMFAFLEQTKPNSLDFVTALGIEYVLLEEGVFEKFLVELRRCLNPGGVVLVFPTEAKYLRHNFEKMGFRKLPAKITTCLYLQKT